MKDTIVTLKNGKVFSGPLWTWRPREGWMELAGEELMKFNLRDIKSAITKNEMVRYGIIEDVDELQRAIKDGWDGK